MDSSRFQEKMGSTLAAGTDFATKIKDERMAPNSENTDGMADRDLKDGKAVGAVKHVLIDGEDDEFESANHTAMIEGDNYHCLGLPYHDHDYLSCTHEFSSTLEKDEISNQPFPIIGGLSSYIDAQDFEYSNSALPGNGAGYDDYRRHCAGESYTRRKEMSRRTSSSYGPGQQVPYRSVQQNVGSNSITMSGVTYIKSSPAESHTYRSVGKDTLISGAHGPFPGQHDIHRLHKNAAVGVLNFAPARRATRPGISPTVPAYFSGLNQSGITSEYVRVGSDNLPTSYIMASRSPSSALRGKVLPIKVIPGERESDQSFTRAHDGGDLTTQVSSNVQQIGPNKSHYVMAEPVEPCHVPQIARPVKPSYEVRTDEGYAFNEMCDSDESLANRANSFGSASRDVRQMPISPGHVAGVFQSQSLGKSPHYMRISNSEHDRAFARAGRRGDHELPEHRSLRQQERQYFDQRQPSGSIAVKITGMRKDYDNQASFHDPPIDMHPKHQSTNRIPSLGIRSLMSAAEEEERSFSDDICEEKGLVNESATKVLSTRRHRDKSTADEWNEDYTTRCFCSLDHNDEFMIQCDVCNVWQHGKCVGVDRRRVPKIYKCEQCHPRKLKLTKFEAREMQQKFLLKNRGAQQSKQRCDSTHKKKEKEKMATSAADTFFETMVNEYSRSISAFSRKMEDSEDSFVVETLRRIQNVRSMFVVADCKGLVADRSFMRDEPVMYVSGRICLQNECEGREVVGTIVPYVFLYSGLIIDDVHLSICIDARKVGCVSRYIRMSCAPNVKLKHVFHAGKLHFIGIALCHIDRLDELCIPFDYDYELSQQSLQCACTHSFEEDENIEITLCEIKIFNRNSLKLNSQMMLAKEKKQLQPQAAEEQMPSSPEVTNVPKSLRKRDISVAGVPKDIDVPSLVSGINAVNEKSCASRRTEVSIDASGISAAGKSGSSRVIKRGKSAKKVGSKRTSRIVVATKQISGILRKKSAVKLSRRSSRIAAAMVETEAKEESAEGESLVNDRFAEGESSVNDRSAEDESSINDRSAEGESWVNDRFAEGESSVNDRSAEDESSINDRNDMRSRAEYLSSPIGDVKQPSDLGAAHIEESMVLCDASKKLKSPVSPMKNDAEENKSDLSTAFDSGSDNKNLCGDPSYPEENEENGNIIETIAGNCDDSTKEESEMCIVKKTSRKSDSTLSVGMNYELPAERNKVITREDRKLQQRLALFERQQAEQQRRKVKRQLAEQKASDNHSRCDLVASASVKVKEIAQKRGRKPRNVKVPLGSRLDSQENVRSDDIDETDMSQLRVTLPTASVESLQSKFGCPPGSSSAPDIVAAPPSKLWTSSVAEMCASDDQQSMTKSDSFAADAALHSVPAEVGRKAWLLQRAQRTQEAEALANACLSRRLSPDGSSLIANSSASVQVLSARSMLSFDIPDSIGARDRQDIREHFERILAADIAAGSSEFSLGTLSSTINGATVSSTADNATAIDPSSSMKKKKMSLDEYKIRRRATAANSVSEAKDGTKANQLSRPYTPPSTSFLVPQVISNENEDNTRQSVSSVPGTNLIQFSSTISLDDLKRKIYGKVSGTSSSPSNTSGSLSLGVGQLKTIILGEKCSSGIKEHRNRPRASLPPPPPPPPPQLPLPRPPCIPPPYELARRLPLEERMRLVLGYAGTDEIAEQRARSTSIDQRKSLSPLRSYPPAQSTRSRNPNS